ncbi:MAG: ECF-type sigma factor [Planctomycetota bacterium]
MADSKITHWINLAKEGDASAYEALWNHYFASVVALAKGRMFKLRGSLYDEEDAALSAMKSLFRGINSGRFPELHDRDNLWRLLVVITHRKLRAQWRMESAEKRAASRTTELNIETVLSEEPSAAFVSEMMDQVERLMSELGDERLKRIAMLRLDGFTYDEIAEQLDCTNRTVCRKVERIRHIWGKEMELLDAED